MAAGMTHLKGADHNDRGSFDILAEQKILVIGETKWYEIGLRPEGCFNFTAKCCRSL